jgi:hypothetical protein
MQSFTVRRALAAATALAAAAGISVVVATQASAATAPATVNLAPSAAAVRPSTAQTYSGIARDASGAGVSGASVTVTATQKVSSLPPSNPLTVSAAGATEKKTQSGLLTYTYTDTVTLTTSATGSYSFAVASKHEGSVSIAVTSGTATGKATLAVSAGGKGDAAVHLLTVTPTSAAQWTGGGVGYTVTAKDSSGKAVPGAQIDYRVASGPDASANGSHLIFGSTNSSGQVSGTIVNDGLAGTDTMVFFVDAGSVPSATSVTSFYTVPVSTALTVSTPSDGGPAALRDEVRAGAATSVPFTATLRNGSAPVPNAVIVFTPSGAATGAHTAVTNGAGQATISIPVTAANAAAGKKLSVVASVGVAGKANYRESAAKTVTFTAPAPYLTFTPSTSVQAAVGGTASVTAHVVDQFGASYPSQSLTWAVNGRNGGLNGTVHTDASGSAVISYTDRGTSGTTDTVTVTDTTTGSVNSNPATTKSVTVTFLRTVTPSKVGTVSGLPVSTTVSSTNSYPVSTIVTNSDGTALTFQPVTVTVDRGWVGAAGTSVATGTKSYKTTTDASGRFTAYVGSTQTGTQTITISAGTSGVGSASLLYTAAPAYQVHLVRASAYVPPAGTTKYTATVRDEYGNAVAGAQLRFTSTGPAAFTTGTSPVAATSDSTGTASITLGAGSAKSGTGTVVAALATTPAQASDTTLPPTSSSSVNYTIGTPAGVVASVKLKASAGYAGGTEHVVGLVRDGNGKRLAHRTVTFTVRGANHVRSTKLKTNQNGIVVLKYRAQRPGTDTVTAVSSSVRATTAAVITERPRLTASSPAAHTVRLVLTTLPRMKGEYAYLYTVSSHHVRRYLGLTRTNAHGVAVYEVQHLKSGKRYAFSAYLANFAVPETYAKTVRVRVQ